MSDQSLEDLLPDHEHSRLDLLGHLYAYCGATVSRRESQVFTLETGHLGISELPAQPGDIVAVVLGCANQLNLRPVVERGAYEIVDACFVHGINWGEAMYGPEIETYRFDWLFDEKVLYKRTDFVTGEVFDYDPRLVWGELEVTEEEASDDSFREAAFAPNDGKKHKRPDAEYFRRREVPLQTITLV